jgi:hypothetical protein
MELWKILCAFGKIDGISLTILSFLKAYQIKSEPSVLALIISENFLLCCVKRIEVD